MIHVNQKAPLLQPHAAHRFLPNSYTRTIPQHPTRAARTPIRVLSTEQRTKIRDSFPIREAVQTHETVPNPLRRYNLPDLHAAHKKAQAQFTVVQFSDERPHDAFRVERAWLEMHHPERKLRSFIPPSSRENNLKKTDWNEVEQFVLSQSSKDRKERISGLEKYIYNEDGGIARFDKAEADYLFKTLEELGAYDLMVEMMEFSPTLKESILNLLAYCKAHLRSSYYNPQKILDITSDIIKNKKKHIAEAYFIEGLVYMHKYQNAKDMKSMTVKKSISLDTLIRYKRSLSKEDNPELTEYQSKLLGDSIICLEEAFNLKNDPLYGEHLIYQLLEKGDEEQAHDVAVKIWDNRPRDGISNYETIRAILAAGIMVNAAFKSLEFWTNRLIATCSHDFQIKESLETLHLLDLHNAASLYTILPLKNALLRSLDTTNRFQQEKIQQ